MNLHDQHLWKANDIENELYSQYAQASSKEDYRNINVKVIPK